MLANWTDALAFIVGALGEILIFSRGEWDRHAPKIIKRTLMLQAGVACLLIAYGSSLTATVGDTARLTTLYLAGLYGTMITYRVFFHPLRSFPGPFGARISALWAIKENVPDLKFYVKLRKLHDEYGDFVRIRPREISVCNPDAILDVHGPRSKMLKGEFYDQQYPHQSLQLTRDPAFHHRKRRVWDRMFSPKALHEYEPRLLKHYLALMSIFYKASGSGTIVDAEKLFMDMGFDIVSDLTFGESWNQLTTGKPHPIIKEYNEGKRAIGYIVSLMWVFHILKALPPVGKRIKYWLDFYGGLLQERKKMNISPDFYTHFSQAERFEEDAAHDAQLAVIAGADTVAITLSNIFYHLAQHSEFQSRLYEELEEMSIPGQDHISDSLLAGKPYLHGIINEVLRLHPPVPFGLQRVTPSEGAVIAGQYIPGGMIVTTPTYSLHRDKRAFVNPDELIPERWSSRPELILRKDAFVPFSYGPYNCTGRPLAMMHLRMVVAMVVTKFEVSFPPGREYDIRKFIEKQADCFVMHLHPLPLNLKERKQGDGYNH